MKKFLLVLAIAFAYTQTQAQTTLPAAKSIIEETCKEAAAQHKKAFIMFHASWCGWCHKMDKNMNDSSLRKYFSDNYVANHITVFETDSTLDNPGAKAFLAAHNAADQGIPAWFIFDGSGNLLADSQMQTSNGEGTNVGCPSAEQEVAYFIQVLEKTSYMNKDEKLAVEKVFSKATPSVN